MSPDNKQIGGTHYQSNKTEFMHWNLVIAYSIPYLPAVASKYLFRWKLKNGIQDLEKAGHYVQKAIESFPKQKIIIPIQPEVMDQLKAHYDWDQHTFTAIRDIISPRFGYELECLRAAEKVIERMVNFEKLKLQQEKLGIPLHGIEDQPKAEHLNPPG